jgi:hypothetical protein
MRAYPIHGQRRISADTRQGRPLCACAQVGAGSKLYAWVGCTDCHGTGGAGASPATHRPSRVCNSSSLTEGM